MADRDKKIVDYMVVVVSEYADVHGISDLEAFRRLDSCGGMQALQDNYDIEHTLPISSTIEALDALCDRMSAA